MLSAMPGSLTLCATPIGNLADTSPRLAETLANVDVVFAEDTRRTRKLLAHLGLDTPLRSYFVGNEAERSREVEARLRAGERIALVTDAGTPGVADPGVSAVQAAVEAGATVSVIPGPSAVTAALAVSGFGADRFVFEGFLPRKRSERRERIANLVEDTRTVVFFMAPKRAARELAELAELLSPERSVVVARELTKVHEEIWRGTLAEAADQFATARGEITVVVEGAASSRPSLEQAIADVQQLVADGLQFSEAVRLVAEQRGVGRGRLYNAAR